MKKKSIVFLIISCWALIAGAQQVSTGGHLGISLSNMPGHEVYNSSLYGFTAGISGQYQFDKYTAMCIELNYEQRGGEGSVSYYNIVGERTLSYSKKQYLHYASIPVLLRVGTGYKNFLLFAKGGFYYGTLAYAWANPQDKDVSHNTTNIFARNDIGVSAGTGIEWGLSKSYFIAAEWRYNYGLADISKATNGWTNRASSVCIGFRYLLSSKQPQLIKENATPHM